MSDAQLALLFFFLFIFPWEVMAALVATLFHRNTDRSSLPGVRSGNCVTQESSAQVDAALK